MSTASTFEQEMLTLINQERTSRGLNPVQLETRLNDSSEDHSQWMLEADRFSHTGQNGSSATQRMADAGFEFEGARRSGENIAWQSERGAEGISDDVEQLHQSLMDSPGHRANILNPDYDYIGIGIEEGDYDGWDAVMVTQNFASTDAQVVLDDGSLETPIEEVAEPETPVEEQPETDVTNVDDPQPEAPVEETPETPDTDVTETEEPDATDIETPDITESEEPDAEQPDTDATDPNSPETDLTDAPGKNVECFDVAAFIAEIEVFLETLKANLDQFAWSGDETNQPDSEFDDFELVMMDEPAPDAPSNQDIFNADADDCFVVNVCQFDCMWDAA